MYFWLSFGVEVFLALGVLCVAGALFFRGKRTEVIVIEAPSVEESEDDESDEKLIVKRKRFYDRLEKTTRDANSLFDNIAQG